MQHSLLTQAAMVCAIGLSAVAAPAPARAQSDFSASFDVAFAPPDLPDYDQPAMPGDGYIWTPGYWAWDEDEGDYYWAPGTWVLPPREDLLWTPAYWAYDNGRYMFISGYWDTEIGYYGGVDYGYGYGGRGYDGGQWRNHRFFYNRTVNNLGGARLANFYVGALLRRPGGPRASFNGGAGGMTTRPTAQQRAWAGRPHLAPTPDQIDHVRRAATQPTLRAGVNHGAPPIAATSRPADFSGPGVVTRAVAPRAYQRPTPPSRTPTMGAPATPPPFQPRPVREQPAPDVRRPTPNRSPSMTPDGRAAAFRSSRQPQGAAAPPPQPDVGRGQGNGPRQAPPNVQAAPRSAPPPQARPDAAPASQPAMPGPNRDRGDGRGPDQPH